MARLRRMPYAARERRLLASDGAGRGQRKSADFDLHLSKPASPAAVTEAAGKLGRNRLRQFVDPDHGRLGMPARHWP